MSTNKSDINVMNSEIQMIPDVMQNCMDDVHGHIAKFAQSIHETGVEHLVLTGCGDSAFAGLATTLAFTKHAQLPTRGIHAIDLARYDVRYLPKNTVAIGLSFSGKVGRTAEAAIQVKKHGHRFIALTNAPSSQLGTAAGEILPIEVPTLGFSPGTSSYVGMLMTLFALAGNIAQLRGSSALLDELRTAPALAAETLRLNNDLAVDAATVLAKHEWISFIGAGPNEASAKFGAAKLFEGPQQIGSHTNIEEWAHEEYFATKEHTPIVVIAPSGASLDRAQEIVNEIEFLGAIPIVISDHKISQTGVHLPLAGHVSEEISPLLTCLPLSLVGFHLARIRGKESYNFKDEETRTEHYDTIHRLTIGEPA